MASHQRDVVWVPNAHKMLDEAIVFISSWSSTAADDFIVDVFNAADTLYEFADAGRAVPELGRRDIREIFVGQYRLQYRLDPDQAQIVAFCRERL
jgi:toxin ParE1/3/4